MTYGKSHWRWRDTGSAIGRREEAGGVTVRIILKGDSGRVEAGDLDGKRLFK